MGNLGWYQRITWLSKKVGGPKNLLALVGGAGGVLALAVEHSPIGRGIGRVKDTVTAQFRKEIKMNDEMGDCCMPVYTVHTQCDCGGGLILYPGDRFKVVQRDDDVALIEVEGNDDNPYFVSVSTLIEHSDFDENR